MQDSIKFSILQQTQKWAADNSIPCQAFHELNSTNVYSKELSFDSHLQTKLVVAGFQTEGKGRGDHHWESTKDSNLLSSWCLQLPNPIQINPTFSCKVGLALYSALKSTWPWISFNLKAPNDIYIEDKKLAGLLIEFVQDKNIKLIIGLGLNVFESPLPKTSVCLSQVLNSSELNPTSWNYFLSNWNFQWNQLFEKNTGPIHTKTENLEPDNRNVHSHLGIQSFLNTFQCVSLLNALNNHPLLSEKYISINSDGSLETSKGLIHWSNL